MLLNILQGTGQTHTTENYLALNVQGAKVERPECFSTRLYWDIEGQTPKISFPRRRWCVSRDSSCWVAAVLHSPHTTGLQIHKPPTA